MLSKEEGYREMNAKKQESNAKVYAKIKQFVTRTAYFKDFSEIKIHHMNMLSFAFIKNEKGNSIIRIKLQKEPNPKIKKCF